ncbi:RRG9 [Candida oxycetoniae]|uniref:Required for respiratory growth protein 9, mitochondrial n=1 Tax=Candida oxycetoniae TaxID=497107 RepID=A0AAI9WZD9_9ASCO|nr:RRG9 [Candida oxycetoniae]KAI3406098.2 RRG9 [Candida oxycetoniae]
MTKWQQVAAAAANPYLRIGIVKRRVICNARYINQTQLRFISRCSTSSNHDHQTKSSPQNPHFINHNSTPNSGKTPPPFKKAEPLERPTVETSQPESANSESANPKSANTKSANPEPTKLESDVLLTKEMRASLPHWVKRTLTQKSKYQSWNPQRKLSRQEMINLRELKETFPHYKTIDLAQFFHISPEAVRRILKSTWVPNDRDEDRLFERRERQKLKKEQQALESKKISIKRKRIKETPSKIKQDRNTIGLNNNYRNISSKF